MSWNPSSWKTKPIVQQPEYKDPAALAAALEQVTALPPLVHSGEIEALKAQLAEVARGERFLLQGGDCAERFIDCAQGPIENKLRILLQMSLVLTWGARMPVVRVGRLAGQNAKPRSRATEVVDGVEVHSYRGDIINGHDPSDREPDPRRLIQATFHSAATLNYVRALLDGGFADLRHPEHWDLGFVRSPEHRGSYEDLVGRLLDALEFMRATGVERDHALRTVELYTSHEGLFLPYEQAHTVGDGGRYHNLGTHMLWIGDRTRQLDGAHVEYFRGISNPIGLKVGPTLQPENLVSLLEQLDPDQEPGRITLITRFGHQEIAGHLPPLIEAVQKSGRLVVWSCDPMHGNTTTATGGFKTRDFSHILSEIRAAFEIHESLGSVLGGVHLELTGEDVTECIGGAQGIAPEDLSRSYETFCDPRLNYAQSLEVALLIARRLSQARA
ncbi:MAG: 3-deoxy-7-phosphoheptulonate synthase class II [Myxococcota bacterium]|nr:3-deoxy-7-phosphoheptulonate synthase class II [Myxococcota bacterium]